MRITTNKNNKPIIGHDVNQQKLFEPKYHLSSQVKQWLVLVHHNGYTKPPATHKPSHYNKLSGRNLGSQQLFGLSKGAAQGQRKFTCCGNLKMLETLREH